MKTQDPALHALLVNLAVIIGFPLLALITERLTKHAGPRDPARPQSDFKKDFKNWLINIF